MSLNGREINTIIIDDPMPLDSQKQPSKKLKKLLAKWYRKLKAKEAKA
jgi:hypothetical protein